MKIKYFTTKFSYSIEFSKLLITKKKKRIMRHVGLMHDDY